MYDAIRIADINVNYGRMTPLSQSAMEDNGASATGSESVNMESAFGSADNYSTKLADVFYKISDQQQLVWSYKGNTLDKGNNKVAPIAFFKATNYEAVFYSLSDIALVDQMTNNIEYTGQAWPCENTKEANTEEPDHAFTYHGGKGYGTWKQDKDLYEFQDQCLKIPARQF